MSVVSLTLLFHLDSFAETVKHCLNGFDVQERDLTFASGGSGGDSTYSGGGSVAAAANHSHAG